MAWTDDVERFANASDAKFQLTLDVDQLAAWIVVASAARDYAAEWLHDEERQEVLDALEKANEAKPVRIA